MPNYKLLLALAVALAAFASAADTNTTSFDLWLKCKAIELYLNVTGANVTIPCNQALQQIRIVNFTKMPLPMIGIGELRKLNVSNPWQVFNELREIRRRALANLTAHVEKVRHMGLRELNVTELEEAYNATRRAVETLSRVAKLLRKVNASPVAVAAVENSLKWINATRQLLWTLLQGDRWIITAVGNASDAEFEEALRRVEELRREWAALWDRLEETKLAWRELVRKRAERWLNETNSTLWDIWIAARINRGEVIKYIRAGNLTAIREIAERAKREMPDIAEKMREIAEKMRERAREIRETVEKGKGQANRGR